MHPILLRLGPVTIYSYGFMVALGFAIATFLIRRQTQEFGFSPDKILDLAIIILLTGIIGARILYVILNLKFYAGNPKEIINLTKGGLVWYGGFASALLAAVFYIRRNGLNFWRVGDLIAPYIALAQSIGRVGCYLNGCCFGIAGHPTQLYSSLLLLFIFAVLRIWQDERHFDGEIFLGYCILYAVKRFFMEFLRGDNPKAIFNLTIFQMTSALIFIIALIIFTSKAVKWRRGVSGSK